MPEPNPVQTSAHPDPIKHVVLLMMENHSFDQMLGCMKAFDPDVEGVDPKNPGSNKDARGNEFFQSETNELQTNCDPKHEHVDVMSQLENDNGGFLADFCKAYPGCSDEDKRYIMGYYPRGFLPALHTLAQQFTICDRWFSSLPGPTWPNRFFALSGTSSGEVKMFNSLKDRNFSAWDHQDQPTLFDRLSAKGKTWRTYFYDFPQSFTLKSQRKTENRRNYFKIDDFFTQDVPGPEEKFPEFVFIEPQYFGETQNDDHPPYNTMRAEKLIADVYNALRSNDGLWKSTLLVVVYDEHGGFYDHVPPPATVAPDDRTDQYAFNRLGVRVPALLISPWVGRRVEHSVFDHTSLLKYLIEKWDLGSDSLGRRAAWSETRSIGVALRNTALPDDQMTRFIRVPNSQLVSPNPGLEKSQLNSHQANLHAFADYCEVAAFADATSAMSGLTWRWGQFIGWARRNLAALADKTSQVLMASHRAREAKTADIAKRMIKQANETPASLPGART